jgi:hypothetical protein
VRSGFNGYLAEDEPDVRTALERLVRSPELRLTFGRRNREIAQAYDMPLFRERYRELIGRLADERDR